MVDEFDSEEEQIKAIKQWFAENGAFIIGGLALGLSALFGYQWWEQRVETRLATASGLYSTLLTAVEERERSTAVEMASMLANDFGDTEYVAQASLALAKMHMDADEPADAAAELTRVLTLSKDDQLKTTARLRLARVELYQSKAERALTTLAEGESGEFAPLFNEVRGDALLALGRESEARQAYQDALDSMEIGGDRRLLEMKLAAVGGAMEETAATAEDTDS